MGSPPPPPTGPQIIKNSLCFHVHAHPSLHTSHHQRHPNLNMCPKSPSTSRRHHHQSKCNKHPTRHLLNPNTLPNPPVPPHQSVLMSHGPNPWVICPRSLAWM